jgi:hypothetical protein
LLQSPSSSQRDLKGNDAYMTIAERIAAILAIVKYPLVGQSFSDIQE